MRLQNIAEAPAGGVTVDPYGLTGTDANGRPYRPFALAFSRRLPV